MGGGREKCEGTGQVETGGRADAKCGAVRDGEGGSR